jgi:prolyl-tRNA synthetase
MAAAIEQGHDENGIVWPKAIAPYDVHVLSLHGGSAEVRAEAEHMGGALEEAGLEVLLDDRDERPGEKFADADLVGLPVRLTVGRKTLEDGAVDVRMRRDTSDQRISTPDVLKWVQER